MTNPFGRGCDKYCDTRPALVAVLVATALAGPVCAAESDPAPLPVEQIANGVFVARGRHEVVSADNRGHVANLSFIVGREAVAVIDTGGSFAVGLALRAAIRRVTPLPVRYVVNSHVHPDHLFGNAAFRGDDVEFLGHHRLARALTARGAHYLRANRELIGAKAFAGTQIIPPTRGVENRLRLDLGGRSLVLVARPTGHTDTDLTVFDEQTGTLWLGDLLFLRHIPVIDGSLRGWMDVLAELKTVHAVRVVPGHGPASAEWPGAAEPQLRYLKSLAANVRRAIAAGRSLGETLADVPVADEDDWLLADEFHKRNISAAYAELEWE